MKKNILFLFLFCISIYQLTAQKIPSPSDFLGYQLGEHFTRHHQVIDYFKHIATISNKVLFTSYGQTNERRTLAISYISSEENIANLETIRKQHLANTGIEKNAHLKNKSIVWLSYNVHGNEASSTEAAMLTLYQLITTHKNLLENTVVIMDPCLNPDGRDRYVNWYNQMVGKPNNTNAIAREHNEPWPGGRPNHYLFDLNRDWVWATQIETQQRLKIYNQWLPHIHVDFHEQYIDNPYYFAPAAEPFHEIITKWQRDFQTEIGKNHAKYFDKNGWYYFTRESFDLLYPSYGDTYPTFNGAIGMTYEQAGHGKAGLGIIKSDGDELTLYDRLLHHTTTGISTIEMASKNVEKINSEFEKYFSQPKENEYKSYALNGNESKIKALTQLLDKHEIEYGFSNQNTFTGYHFQEAKNGQIKTSSPSLIVSTNQPKNKLITSLFEPNTKLNDSITYDITAWSIPYAYGLDAIASKKLISGSTKKYLNKKAIVTANAYAYVFEWKHISDADLLSTLLNNNFRVRFTEKKLRNSGHDIDRGSIIITKGDNKQFENFDSKIIEIATNFNKHPLTITSGFSDEGPDMGSPSIKEIKNQKIAVLSGKHTSSLSFGEIQYFFEQTIKYPFTAIDSDKFSIHQLNNFHTLVLPNGYYQNILGKKQLIELKKWIQQGGKVIAIGTACDSFADKEGFELTSKKEASKETEKTTSPKLIDYENLERHQIQNSITGAIFKTNLDNSHPLAFGYDKNYFTLKLGSKSYNYLSEGASVVRIEKSKVISGFAGNNTKDKLNNTLVFGEENIGRGSVIYFIDNPLFRGFWDNGKLFFANALFMTNHSLKKL